MTDNQRAAAYFTFYGVQIARSSRFRLPASESHARAAKSEAISLHVVFTSHGRKQKTFG